MKFTSWTFVCLVTITILSGCAGGIVKKTVNGETSYYKDGKEITRQQAAAESGMIADQLSREQQQARYEKALKNAPRRDKSEPVSVALLEPIIVPGYKVDRAKLNQYWRKAFKNKKMRPLVSRKKIRKSMKSNRSVSRNQDWSSNARARNVPGDTYVQLIIKPVEVLAKNKKTKKISMVTALLYRAEIASRYLSEKIVIEETVVNIFKNVEQLNTLAKNVGKAISTDIRPKLPSAKWIKQQKKNDLEQLVQALKQQAQSE